MKEIFIDIETYSSVDLSKSGVYRYAEADDFAILLFGCSVDGGLAKVVDLENGETIPEEVLSALTDDSVIKWAHNCSFERVCISAWLKKNRPDILDSYYLDPVSWRCSMVWSAYLGLPHSLSQIGTVLGLDQQKMTEGKELIRYFCMPCKATRSNGGRTRNLPCHAPDKWDTFKRYNLRDVEVEMSICKRLQAFPVPGSVWEEYCQDQEINDRGIAIDMELVEKAIEFDERSRKSLTERMKALTGLDNPNSVMQLRVWLESQGFPMETLGKKEVSEVIDTAKEPIRTVLSLRQQLAKSSVKKYQAMANAVCRDGRARGMFKFYGASRSGRFSGAIIQLQNLRRNSLPDLDEARALVRSGNYEATELLYGDVPDTLSQLVRTAFVPRQGRKFIVADFSAIEARVISWLAGETWKIKAFAEGQDIYCSTASQMFGVPVVKHGVNGELRQKGKIAELACIAKGELVLTDKGLVPIEDVTTEHRLWDGEEWVAHEGVVYRGEREVMEYEGLRATADHLVWVEEIGEPMPFGTAVFLGLALKRGIPGTYGTGGGAFRCLGRTPVYDIRNAGPHHRFTVSGHLVHNCGYGGSVGALKAMGALEMGLQESELKGIVDMWRKANPAIVQLWWDVDRCVRKAVVERTTESTSGLVFSYRSGMLFITLPSGRSLAYVKPQMGINKFGSDSVTYEGLGLSRKWERIESYGPKFVENIVQGIARDILCYAMQTVRHCNIVAHVHDELIIECGRDASVEVICGQMGRTPSWADGLLLRADGYECDFYKKD